MSEKPSCLLPNSIVPAHYEIHLQPDFVNFTFAGTVSININIHESVDKIILHAADLEIKSSDVAVWFDENNSVVCKEINFDAEAQTATFAFPNQLPKGEAILKIKYTGILNDKMVGFYRSKYVTASGQEKYLATTQFEATDARRALPCWDEPARKATFDVNLIVPKNLVALSNMPVKSTKVLENTDLQTVSFERTPIMSTYLLAFVVGEFEFVETKTNNGTLVRVYTMLKKSHQGMFALDVGRRSLELYNNYFAFPYPLPKLDMIAIPDFASGAMENWGLVTYRENALLIDETNSSSASKQRVAEVVAHELAHQWFGNLVTMQWWTNLWLNEGFASWMASFVLDKLFPEWDIWTQFLADDYADALSLDGLRSTHPIEIPVNNPNEISQIFDAISYSKGASVIRMIHDFLGADIFRDGLRVYLKRHAYSNAVTEDLWQALAEVSGQPVQKIMNTWTKQAGYPLIQIIQENENICAFSQKRFLASGQPLTKDEADQNWHIPLAAELNHESGQSDFTKYIFSDTSPKINIDKINFIKLNSAQIALARVNYLPQQWQKLAQAVTNGLLSPADRYGILSDALALVIAGHLSSAELINLLSAYKTEDNFVVWAVILRSLGVLGNVLEETPEKIYFESFAKSTLAPIVSRLGWEESADESHTTKLLRGNVLSSMGSYGHDQTVAEAKSRFKNHAANISPAEPNLRHAIYGTAAKHGDKEVFASVVGLYQKETFQEEKVRLLSALGRFADSEFLPTVLEYGFNSGEVRSGDFIYLLGSMGGHANGRRAAWNFLTSNWSSFTQRYAAGGLKMLGRIISLICDGFINKEDAKIIEQFFKDNPAPSADRSIAEAIERINVRAAWYERDKDIIIEALKKLQ
ncbi:MAG TPA: M1 family metallopeptidase [Candidatus Udaeobacter sp.]|nr:M1 family metallopeptidase [Candidatus Udaeobacter sp.]